MSSSEPARSDISMEYYLECHSKRHHTYSVLVVGFFWMLASLPFVTLDVSVNCSGILKPAAEPSLLKALATGLIAKVHVKENTAVKRGTLLFEISSHELQERQHYLRDQIEETSELLRDLDLLMNASTGSKSLARPRNTLTALYRQVFADYTHRLNESRTKLEKISREYARSKILFDGDVISAVDLENSRFEWSRARDEVQSIIQTQLTAWERQLL
ncbi:MAG TPA: biotin/lipoyl-binding protein, partial [Chryseolinea sp.]|nr:biotin/lipoyl-binding protein [Chryseolinea sp.]